MILLIIIAAILMPILFGLIIGRATAGFDQVVVTTQLEVETKDHGFNPALTLGHRIKTDVSATEQIAQARQLAAKKAASLPRGANVRIGRLGQPKLKSAWEGVDNDPMSAVKIAEFHGWQGVKTGAVIGVPVAAAPVAAAGAPVGKIKLVPGKDYEVIELTDDMDPADKRKARIANSKAKSAAMKAAKAAGVTGEAVATPVAAETAVSASAPVAVPTNIAPPQLIELTDDMDPADKRKARIANSKAKSAYNKALKAAGIDPKSVKAGEAVQVAAAAPIATPVAAAPAPTANPAAANIPKPELIELTDDMDPADKRRVRIANSKAKSAYNKALKAAGIDPKSMRQLINLNAKNDILATSLTWEYHPTALASFPLHGVHIEWVLPKFLSAY